MSTQEKARDLMERSREMLEARILGDLIEFGYLDFMSALDSAVCDAAQWRREHPEHIPNYLKLSALAARDVPNDGGAWGADPEQHNPDCAARAANAALDALAQRMEGQDFGLNVDMLDVDRLLDFARCIETIGADITAWGAPSFVAGKLKDIARRLTLEIKDVGKLRQPPPTGEAMGPQPEVIPVPDLDPPAGLCWQPAENMERCTFGTGHKGRHSWQL